MKSGSWWKHSSQSLFLSIGFAVLVFLVTSCSQNKDTGRIRLASSPISQDTTATPSPADIPDVSYSLTLNGAPWTYPAKNGATISYDVGFYSDTVFHVVIDNSFIRNDTAFYDELELSFNNTPNGDVKLVLGGSLQDGQANYNYGTNYYSQSGLAAAPSYSSYPPESDMWLIYQDRYIKQYSVYIYTVGNPDHLIQGTLQIAVR